MAKKYFNRIFYRAATTIPTTATKGGSYPDFTMSGWTLLVGIPADKSKVGIDVDGKEAAGDGSEYISGEQVPIEIPIFGFTGANYATLRSAMINQKLDFLFFDADQPTEAYAACGIRAYPKLDIAGGEEPKIVISGARKCGAGITNTPFQYVTVS